MMSEQIEETQGRTKIKTWRQNRGRVDVIGDILHLCSTETIRKKTHLMQVANLSTDMLNDYLGYLLGRELLREVEMPRKKKPAYAITERGFGFLTHYRQMKHILGEDHHWL